MQCADMTQIHCAKNIAELLLLLYKVVVLHLSCLGPLYVMGTYQEYEDQHKTEFIVDTFT
jgi:hypothetical protein